MKDQSILFNQETLLLLYQQVKITMMMSSSLQTQIIDSLLKKLIFLPSKKRLPIFFIIFIYETNYLFFKLIIFFLDCDF